ncbi:hypothetical protein [Rhizorhabdus dicambivorans]|nr:hypothetical protein [Rhizorhabdus dicambivorans]
MMMFKDNTPLDHLASDLAADAGQAWKDMADFPGYKRTIWRDTAKLHVRRHIPDARVECLPSGWDGKEGVCFIRKR